MRLTVTAILLLLAFSSSHAGKFYKWVDSEGVTHYSAQPPHDKPVQTVNVKTGESVASDNSETADSLPPTQSPATQNPVQSTPPAAEEKVIVLPAPAQKDPVKCEESRKFRQTLESNKLRIKDEETGEYRYRSRDEIQQWLEWSDRDIRRYCH